MPIATTRPDTDILRRLDELPIPSHERELARAQARIAFRIVDALCDAANDARAGFDALRRGTHRLRRAH